MNATLFIALTIVDSVTALILFAGFMSDRMRLFPVWHKLGLLLAVAGLLSQVFRNLIYLTTGVSPSDSDTPMWALKDLGIDCIGIYYFSIAMKRRYETRTN